MRDKLHQFAPATLTANLGVLPATERSALATLIEAGRVVDPLFDRQVYAGYSELRAALAADPSPEGRLRLEYFDVMRGPWDRQDHHRPFATDKPHPPGAGFYPEDLGEPEFRAWLERHPEAREAFESPVMLIARRAEGLAAVPYSEAYAEWLEPCATLLERAARETTSVTLAAFLNSRAAAFRSNDYYDSEKAWMDLEGPLEITIGPYETYEDDLLGLKAAFEAFVTVTDPDASAKLSKYKSLLPAMEQHLPVPDDVKTTRGADSPIRVVDLVFSAGDARKSVQTMAFNLPNDERVRAEKGAKKVLLRNVIQAKFDAILAPIAERLIDPAQLMYLSRDGFFQETLFHELSHSLGPAFADVGGRRVEARVALGPSYTAVEECKADVMGAYNVLFMIDRGEFPQAFRSELLLSYFAGLFRATRFGVVEAHGQGAAMQINRFLEEGAVRFDPGARTFTVDFARLEPAIERLVRDLCLVQHRGDQAQARVLLARYGVMSEPMRLALGGLGGIPIDLRPIYPTAGE